MRRAFIFLFAALISISAPAAAAVRPNAHAQLVADAIAAAERGHLQFASKLVKQSPDPIARKLVNYFYLMSPNSAPSFSELAVFLDANPEWPGRKDMQVRAEHSLEASISLARRLSWFKRYPPHSIRGRYMAAETFLQSNDATTGVKLLREVWGDGGLPLEIEREILQKYRRHLSPADHKARFENLLWRGQRDAAQRMYRIVDKDLELLGRARLSLRYNAPDVERAISKVPRTYRNDPGLFYERTRWRLENSKPQSALELARELPKLSIPNGDAGELWWKHQDALSRMALAERDYGTAYRVAATHAFTAKEDTALFAEAEWLAGWISLRFLHKPEQALPHFTRMHEAVAFPTMRSRGAYWAGRAAEAKGDKQTAARWFATAANFPATYYGQLAMARRGGIALPHAMLDNTALPDKGARQAFSQQELVRATQLLLHMKRDRNARQFFQALVETSKSPQSYRLAAMLAQENNRPELGMLAAKLASREGVWLFEAGYPVINLPKNVDRNGGLEDALILAVSRQESGFNTAAISPAGARGLMQLMPATAKDVARSLKVSYQENLLITNPVYNTRLGSFYLSQMLRRFDGSYALALAAYNAGGSRANAWSKLYGDPLRPDTDVVDWVEQIPFGETRNYVQRVMENVGVYRMRLGNTADPFRLDRDLMRGRDPAQSYDAPRLPPPRDPVTGTRTRS